VFLKRSFQKEVLQRIEYLFADKVGDKLQDPSATYAKWLRDGGGGLFERDGSSSLDLQVKASAPSATIFLDEFQDLPKDVQALMMRLLEQGEMEPLGYNGKIRLVDSKGHLHVRVIGASNSLRVRRLAIPPTVTRAQSERPGSTGAGDGGAQAAPVPQQRPDAHLAEQQEDMSNSRNDGGVRDDLVYRLARWVVVLPDVHPEEVRAFVRAMGLERTWQPGAYKALEEAIKAERLPGHRRQLAHVIRRATAIAEYDNAGGKMIAKSKSVEGDHVERALDPDWERSKSSPGLQEPLP
jgi:hypothetical protein